MYEQSGKKKIKLLCNSFYCNINTQQDQSKLVFKTSGKLWWTQHGQKIEDDIMKGMKQNWAELPKIFLLSWIILCKKICNSSNQNQFLILFILSLHRHSIFQRKITKLSISSSRTMSHSTQYSGKDVRDNNKLPVLLKCKNKLFSNISLQKQMCRIM